MTRYRLAIFDFDGTLADTFPFFVGAFNGLAAQHGFRPVDAGEMPALKHYDARRMMRHVGMPAWKLPIVAQSFVALMRDSVDEIRLFDGVDAALAHLDRSGIALAVVSSNSRENVDAVLGPANSRLMRHHECGMSMFGKASRIRKVLRESGVQPREAICVGDQVTDLEAARKAGTAFGAVAWGYGSLESLRTCAPEEIFERVSELERIAG